MGTKVILLNFIELAPREAQKGQKKAAKNQKLTKVCTDFF